MAFNSTDFTKAPWASGVMTLTHEEVLHVKTATQEIEANYKPEENGYEPVSDFYVQSEYNKIDWTKGVNGDTYSVIKQYDVEVNTLGIDEQGIVQEEVVEPVEQPIEEVVVEEAPQ